LNAFHASSLISVIVSVKLSSSIISLRICGPSNIPSLILTCDNEENFVHRYWKHGLFQSNALTNCFIISSLLYKGGSRIFSRSTRLTFETFLDHGCSCSLSGQCTGSQYLSLALLSHSHKKQGNFVYPLCCPSSNPMTFKSSHICHSCSNFNVSYDSDSFAECASGMEASTLLFLHLHIPFFRCVVLTNMCVYVPSNITNTNKGQNMLLRANK
jgi:hypothetical protein